MHISTRSVFCILIVSSLLGSIQCIKSRNNPLDPKASNYDENLVTTRVVAALEGRNVFLTPRRIQVAAGDTAVTVTIGAKGLENARLLHLVLRGAPVTAATGSADATVLIADRGGSAGAATVVDVVLLPQANLPSPGDFATLDLSLASLGDSTPLTFDTCLVRDSNNVTLDSVRALGGLIIRQ